MFDIDTFLKQAVSMGASDVHLHTGEHPAIRKDGTIIKINLPELTEDDMKDTCLTLLPEHLRADFYSKMDIDCSYELPGCSRFRVNISKQLGKLGIVIRSISYNIRNLAELGLPETISQFCPLNNGLVLITGPTGSGKSTTMAAMLESINQTMQKHIITLEDPIEYMFTGKKCVISQRQLGLDTETFFSGLKYALRQDPDVILVGEIRDKETVTSALRAAETGHLVFSTIHTNNAIETVNRIVNMFNPADRPFVRIQLADVLRGTISQKLLPLASGQGRCPATEVLVVTSTVKDLIKKNNLEQVYDLVKKGSYNNMITLNESLFQLLQKGIITEEVALGASNDDNELKQMIRGVYHGTSRE